MILSLAEYNTIYIDIFDLISHIISFIIRTDMVRGKPILLLQDCVDMIPCARVFNTVKVISDTERIVYHSGYIYATNYYEY